MTLKRLASILLIAPFLLATYTQSAPAFKDMDSSKRTQAFIEFLAPQVKAVNKEISVNRKRVESLYADVKKNKKLSTSDEQWLRGLALTHQVKDFDVSKTKSFDALLLKVDEIPVPLALAQAACESGWGTSNFARVANNYFGHMCNTRGCGIKLSPSQREGANEIKRFPSAFESVLAYVTNLNSHPAYNKIREIRAKLRKDQKHVDAHALADGLHKYATAKDYVNKIKQMINVVGKEQAAAA